MSMERMGHGHPFKVISLVEFLPSALLAGIRLARKCRRIQSFHKSASAQLTFTEPYDNLKINALVL
jgi:hypothetical protein